MAILPGAGSLGVGRRQGQAYDRRQRRGTFDELMAMASLALAETALTDRLTADAVWRVAVETWLAPGGFVPVSVGGKVLPYLT